MDDLNRAIDAGGGSIFSYATRAAVYEAKGERELEIADLRKTTEMKPKTVFDMLAQATAKQRVQQLSKQLPCGSTGGAMNSSCL